LELRRNSYPKLDYLLFVPGIHGFSTVLHHLNWMDLQSFSISFSSSKQIGANDFHVQKQTDATSPLLWKAVNDSKTLQTANHLTFEVWQETSASTGLIYFSLTFTDPIADSYELSASNGSNGTDSVSFTYRKVDICQYPSVTTGKQGSPQCIIFTNSN